MPKRVAKFAPIGAVATAIGYLCWPYLDDPAKASPQKPSKKAELTMALLSPPEAPDLLRNMFETFGEPGAPPPEVRTSEIEPAAKQTAKADQTASAPASLNLQGTIVHGAQRVALINNSLYKAGDQIPADLTSPTQWRVEHVDVDHVVLATDGQSAELRYAHPLAAHNAQATGSPDDTQTTATASAAVQKKQQPATAKSSTAHTPVTNKSK